MGIAQRIDVENLLIWAYQTECVGHDDRPVFASASLSNPVYGLGMLGTRVDGGAPTPHYPDDALTVEAVVGTLPAYQRQLVVQHATAGTRPNWRPVPTETYPCDAWGARTTKPRHMFAPNDRKKRHPLGCYLGTTGDSVTSLYLKWRDWMWWHEALAAADAALRTGRYRLKSWELADFGLVPHPWEEDPSIPKWLWVRVILTGGKKLDRVPESLRSARNMGS